MRKPERIQSFLANLDDIHFFVIIFLVFFPRMGEYFTDRCRESSFMTDTFKIGGNGGLRLGRRVGVTVDDRSDSLSLGLFLQNISFVSGGFWKDTEPPPGLGWALRI